MELRSARQHLETPSHQILRRWNGNGLRVLVVFTSDGKDDLWVNPGTLLWKKVEMLLMEAVDIVDSLHILDTYALRREDPIKIAGVNLLIAAELKSNCSEFYSKFDFIRDIHLEAMVGDGAMANMLSGDYDVLLLSNDKVIASRHRFYAWIKENLDLVVYPDPILLIHLDKNQYDICPDKRLPGLSIRINEKVSSWYTYFRQTANYFIVSAGQTAEGLKKLGVIAKPKHDETGDQKRPVLHILGNLQGGQWSETESAIQTVETDCFIRRNYIKDFDSGSVRWEDVHGIFEIFPEYEDEGNFEQLQNFVHCFDMNVPHCSENFGEHNLKSLGSPHQIFSDEANGLVYWFEPFVTQCHDELHKLCGVIQRTRDDTTYQFIPLFGRVVKQGESVEDYDFESDYKELKPLCNHVVQKLLRLKRLPSWNDVLIRIDCFRSNTIRPYPMLPAGNISENKAVLNKVTLFSTGRCYLNNMSTQNGEDYVEDLDEVAIRMLGEVVHAYVKSRFPKMN